MKKIKFILLLGLCLVIQSTFAQPNFPHEIDEIDPGLSACETFGVISSLTNMPNFVHKDCENSLPNVTISFYDRYDTVYGSVLEFFITNSTNDNRSSKIRSFNTSFMNVTLPLPEPSVVSVGQQDVEYRLCVTDQECVTCQTHTIRYHDGTYVPSDFTFSTCDEINECESGVFIQWHELSGWSIAGEEPVTGINTEGDFKVCCGINITASIDINWSVGFTVTGSQNLPFEVGITGAQSWTQGAEFTGPSNGCNKYAMYYRECDVQGTYYDFPDICSQNFTTEFFELEGLQDEHAIVSCPVAGDNPCNFQVDPSYVPPIRNGPGGSIDLGIIDPSLIFEIEWQGPDGYQSNEININELDFGRYCYQIKDACCNLHTGCIYLCEGEPEETPFEYNPETGQWCREITCLGVGSSFQTNNDHSDNSFSSDTGHHSLDEVYQECLDEEDLTYGPWEFEVALGKCRREVSYEGTPLGYQEKDPEIKEYYDAFSNTCIREYYCDGLGGAESHSLSEAPSTGNWQVDIIQEVCYQEITCFGALQEDRIEQEIVYEWTYDAFSDQCIGTPTCDGSQVFGAPNRQTFPVSRGSWFYDDLTGECYRAVQCEFGGSSFEERKEAVVEWAYDDFLGQCEATVYCDGFEVFGAGIPAQTPFSLDISWGSVGNTCTRIVQCTFDSQQETATENGEFVCSNEQGSCPPYHVECEVYCFGEDMNETHCSTGFRGEAEPRSNTPQVLNELNLEVQPNPFNDEFTVFLNSSLTEKVRIVIHDLSGKELHSYSQSLIKGRNVIIIKELQDVSSGMYFMTIYDRHQRIMSKEKLIKQ